MQTPTILSVDGQAEFVVLPYIEYVRLKDMARAASGNLMAQSKKASSRQSIGRAPSSSITEIIANIDRDDPTPALSPWNSSASPALSSSIDPLLTVDLHYNNECDRLGGTEVPHAVVQLITRQNWSIVRAWREYLGLKKNDVARKMGITTESYANMEQPYTLLTDSQYLAVANSMGIDIRQIKLAGEALSEDVAGSFSSYEAKPHISRAT